jgi:hypothetical protein
MSTNNTQAHGPHRRGIGKNNNHVHAFLSLPGEIRNTIYDNTFHRNLVPILSARFNLFYIDHRINANLLITCRQIHSELSSRYLPFRYSQSPVIYVRQEDSRNPNRWRFLLDAIDLARSSDVSFVKSLRLPRRIIPGDTLSRATLQMAASDIRTYVRASTISSDSLYADNEELDRALDFIKITLLQLRRTPRVHWRILLDRVGVRYRYQVHEFQVGRAMGRERDTCIANGAFTYDVTLVSRDAERQRLVRWFVGRQRDRVIWEVATDEERGWMRDDAELVRQYGRGEIAEMVDTGEPWM